GGGAGPPPCGRVHRRRARRRRRGDRDGGPGCPERAVVTGARPLAAAAAVAADRVLGEPPAAIHPVAAFGRVMAAIERRTYRDERRAGVVHAAAGLAVAAAAGVALRRLVPSAIATFVAAEVAVAGRMLADAAGEIGAALERGELDAAR